MPEDVVVELDGAPVFVCAPEGPALSSEQDATDLIGNAMYLGATCVAIPVERLDGAFFDLRTGLLGSIAQKFVNYRMRLAIVGDVSAYVAKSNAFRDFVTETNRGKQLVFIPTLDEVKGGSPY
jgi:hypothetical protein